MKPNRSQQQALDSKVSTIISAGAGSGKTAVLTEKVYGLIEQGVIDINNLLVLTFTNAAAYSMKMKIIKKFKEVNSNFKDKVVSAHIQTYDSFSLDLVKKYSLELGLNPHINVVNEALMKSKVKDYINEAIETGNSKIDEYTNLANEYNFSETQSAKLDITSSDEYSIDLDANVSLKSLVLNYHLQYKNSLPIATTLYKKVNDIEDDNYETKYYYDSCNVTKPSNNDFIESPDAFKQIKR